MANETISEKCETLYNKLNTFVTSVISRDVTPKISNLNTEVWGSNTQTGDSRIDTLESDVTSLNNSITDIDTTVNDHTTKFTNMIEKHTWGIPAFSLGSGKKVEKTVTVPNPDGYYRIPLIQGAYKCSASSIGLNGTTLTVKIQNHYSDNANASMYGVILYFKLSIIKEI